VGGKRQGMAANTAGRLCAGYLPTLACRVVGGAV